MTNFSKFDLNRVIHKIFYIIIQEQN